MGIPFGQLMPCVNVNAVNIGMANGFRKRKVAKRNDGGVFVIPVLLESSANSKHLTANSKPQQFLRLTNNVIRAGLL